LRPGDVPNTMLPPEYEWLTGETERDSLPRIFNTQTLSLQVASSASELIRRNT